MKVYELMTLLAEVDAGAEVVYCDLKTIDEFKNGRVDEDAGQEFYEVTGKIKEVELDGNRVFLYA